jgi:hypothetical protein
MPRVSRGGLDAAAAEAQRKRAAARRSLMPAWRAEEEGQEQRIGGCSARVRVLLQSSGQAASPIRNPGLERAGVVVTDASVLCAVCLQNPVSRIQEIPISFHISIRHS